MSSIDIIDAAGDGYRFVWRERTYLARLALFPILIKLICFNLVYSFGFEQNFIAQALVLLPSFFADGWMLAHVARTILVDHRWPFRPSGNMDKDMVKLQERALGILRGTLVFVFTEFLITGVVGIVKRYFEIDFAQAIKDENMAMIFVLMLAISTTIWTFRFLWLYIPAAVNFPIRTFILKLGSFSTSLYLIGLWLVCFLPLLFAFNILVSVLFPGLVENGTAGVSAFEDAAFKSLRVLLDTAVIILTTASMTFAFKQLYQKPDPEKKT
ncbi:MAG: hypothetical protein QF692_07735 [Alphaproteobacteria bacterium]|nr:hypothetical protein [Alphaproteobacteria bacterium]MDP7223137.1 hypothetical protein [Alphaproteobacteria bacterium]